MVLAKTKLFDSDLQNASMLYKAMGHPARLQILRYLAEIKVCITGDISEELPLSRTTVNQHLTELKKAGLIQGHVDGKRTNYCLNPEKVKELKKISEAFLHELVVDNFQCG
ncbi:helix-turn-helix transcriptional regulator [Marinilabilia salmonicolor]|jgi:DNA-binding transcriptional ArsR family regulator|uniref:ArsR family transcriptional regulator n=1 Tax=Marinilabilia salmonicolor TaxID=989 RepID=A0A368VGX4_9BACT|nr:metalloregulator ArsR/SmtB family transcription factor [Marinilabilia salmonicolor]RCW38924.1 ArsR family transcriptional regulator [Marinilabilia salmonicolor]